MMTTKSKTTATATKGRGSKVTKKPATETTKRAVKAKAAKTAKPVVTNATTKTAPAGKLSQMAAAVRVLAKSGEPMNCKEMVEAMATKGYWLSPSGKTPHATLYAVLLRHIRDKGNEARFAKTDRGLFTLAGK